MKDEKLIRRLIELAAADRPALFRVTDDAKAEDLDEALRIISSLRAEEQKNTAPVSRDGIEKG